MDCIIGVDIGTTSTKTIGFDIHGKILARYDQSYPILYPQPTYCEQDPEELYDAVVHTLRAVTEELRLKNHSVLGVSFSCAMHSLIAVDKQGMPLTKAIIWADSRSNDQAERIKSGPQGHPIYLRTGTPIHPMSPLCKLVWMREMLPEVFANAHKFISIKEYIFFRLFGQYIVDYSIASATGLFDIHTVQWSSLALEMAGITPERLSESVPPTHIVRGLSPVLAKELGLAADVPFVVGASDGCLANLSAGATRPGRASLTIGTSGAIRVTNSVPAQDAKERIFCYLLTEKLYVIGGAINNGGVAQRWFRDQFGQPEVAEAKRTDADPYDLLAKLAETVPPGSNHLLFLPYLLGERAPHWDANARGVYFGITPQHTRAHFLRAVLEGILFGIYEIGRALEETGNEFAEISAGGGFARSEMWLQMAADIFNKPVRVAESVESSAMGAAAMGLLALGHFKSIEETEQWVLPGKEIWPDPARHTIYQKLHPIFSALYDKLKGEFRQLSELDHP